MAHQYKVGDKVRIKERKGASYDYPYCFADKMALQKGKIFTIREIKKLPWEYQDEGCKFYNGDNHYYLFKEINYSWHSSMFEPVLENSEQKIQRFISLEVGDLIPICGMIGEIQKTSDGDRYYLDFEGIMNQLNNDHFACCYKLRELIPDFEKIANEYDGIVQESDCFPEFSTIDDLTKFTQAVNNAYNFKKSITTTKTLNENEIRFQKPKTSSVRGSVPTGRAICGRRCKTAIELGHLSNKACHF